MSTDYYKILGVEKTADDAALKKAYRKKAMRWHPDKHSSKSEAEKKKAEEQFKLISEAYSVLSDKDKRRTYDQFGKEGLQPGGAPPPDRHFSGAPQGFGQTGATYHFSSADANEVFAQFFGGGMGGGLGGGMGGGLGGIDLSSLFGGGMGQKFGQSYPSKPQRTRPFNTIKPNSTVIVRGLKSQESLNGNTATVISYNTQKQRYCVRFDDGTNLMIRPYNLIEAVDNVRLRDISSNPSLNGLTGTIVGWNEERKRFYVLVKSTGTTMSLKSSNLVWPNSTTVRINGLKKAVNHNGKWGKIENFDGSRYSIRTGALGEQVLLMKPDNIQVSCSC